MKILSNILLKAGLIVEGAVQFQDGSSAVTVASSDNSTKIATTAFVKNQGYAVDASVVHTTGDESISGIKTFLGSVFVGNSTTNGVFRIYASGGEYGQIAKATGGGLNFTINAGANRLVTFGTGTDGLFIDNGTGNVTLNWSANGGRAFIARVNNSAVSNGPQIEMFQTTTYATINAGKYGGTGVAVPIALAIDGSQKVIVFTDGNTTVGSATNAGFKFDVNGTARIQGDTTITGNLNVGASSSFRATIQSAANDVLSSSLYLNNTNAGTSAASYLQFGASGASSWLGLYSSVHSNPSWAGRLLIGMGSSGNGITISASGGASQDILFAVQTGTVMRMMPNRNVLVDKVTDSGLAKFQVNGAIQQTSVLSSMLMVNSSGVLVSATAGTDYVAPSALTGYVPTTRQITINGTAYDLSADRAWTVSANQNARTEYEFTTNGSTATYTANYSVGQVDVFYNGSKLSSTEFTATNGTSVTLGFTPPTGQLVEVVAWETGGGVSSGRTLTINGVSYDLSANRSWTINNASLGAQPQLNGTGFVKISGTTISYDNTSYLPLTGGTVSNTTSAGNPNVLTIKNNTNTDNGYAYSTLALDTTLANTMADIRLGSTTPLGIRLYAATSPLTATPTGAGFQLFSNSHPSFSGQVYFDSGAHNSAALVFRTAQTGGTITERFRISSAGLATFSGALSGTSATFSGNITIGAFLNTLADQSAYRLYSAANSFIGGIGTGPWVEGSTVTDVAVYAVSNLKLYTGNSSSAKVTIASNGAATFTNSLTATQGYFSSTSGNPQVVAYYGASDYMNIFHNGLSIAGNDLLFSNSAGTERMRIKGGNVGIGVVPSAWSTVVPVPQIGAGGGFIGGQTSANILRVGVNAYYDGSTWRYINSAAACWYEAVEGEFRFINAASGSAGAALTTNEKMRLTSNGTLGIAGSADVNNANLDKISIGHFSGNYGWIQTWNATTLYLNKSGNAVYAGTQRIDNNSDARIKENIESISGALHIVTSLQGRKYNMLDENGKLRYGFVAQEVQPHLSDFVTESERSFEKGNIKIENLLTLESSGASWAALLVEAIKEQQAQIESLKARLN